MTDDAGELINIAKLLDVLRFVHRVGPKTWPEVYTHVGMSRQALWRMLHRAVPTMGVEVEPTDEGPRVTSWGVLNMKEVMRGP